MMYYMIRLYDFPTIGEQYPNAITKFISINDAFNYLDKLESWKSKQYYRYQVEEMIDNTIYTDFFNPGSKNVSL